MLNGPIGQIVGFVQVLQNVKIALERIGEIYNKEDEEDANNSRLSIIPDNKTINISNLSFQYSGPLSDEVLKNINLTIPEGKITAIVGMSGSGKTTLLA